MKRGKVLRVGLITGCIALTLLGASGLFLLNYALRSNHRGKEIQGSYHYIYHEYPFVGTWIDSLQQANALRDTTIYDSDVALHAYYIRAAKATKKVAVIVHGYQDNAIRMLMIGYLYNHDLAFNVLLPDLRYAGTSGGTHIQMGWLDRLDVMRWMQLSNTLFGGDTNMVVHGISMGAATSMMVSGEQQPNYVKCFVEDCGYTSVWEQFKKEIKGQFHLPAFPLLDTANLLCKKIYGWSFKEASALKQVKKCHLPMLFIHGDSDLYVPTAMVHTLYRAKKGAKELWITPNTKHAESYKNYREEYTKRVKKFVEKALLF